MGTVKQKSKIPTSLTRQGDLVKGFNDKLGKEAEKALLIREIAKQTFEKYNYNYVETPIVEYENFVKSGSDEGDDAISEVFRLQDRGKRNLALRYEFTFQLKRIAKNQKLPFKRFQIGECFRDEPVKGNRVREFTQCDIDVVGAKVKDQAELLAAVKDILNALKINSVIYVNNRKLLNEYLKELFGFQDYDFISELIRYIDKLDKFSPNEIIKQIESNKNKSSALKKIQKIQLKNIFYPLLNQMKNWNLEDLKKKYLNLIKKKSKNYVGSIFEEGYNEIEELKKYCKYYGFEIKFLPTLARGLSYYTGNVFEIKSDIKETICGGGTYMVENNVASGISFSIERLMAVSNILIDIERILVVSLNQDKKAIEISKKLRNQGKNVSVFFGKPSKALEYANSYGIKKVLFVGKKEVEQKKFKIKDMKTGKEVLLTIEKIKKRI